MAGLVGLGQAYKAQSRGLLEDVTRREEERKMTNEGLKRQQKVQTVSNVAGGAALGASIASGAASGSAAGPWGAVIGAGVGLLASFL